VFWLRTQRSCLPTLVKLVQRPRPAERVGGFLPVGGAVRFLVLVSTVAVHRCHPHGSYLVSAPKHVPIVRSFCSFLLPFVFDPTDRVEIITRRGLSVVPHDCLTGSVIFFFAILLLVPSILSDSNRPPTDYKSVALPDELRGLYYRLHHTSTA
jgi:hypothetical protein